MRASTLAKAFLTALPGVATIVIGHIIGGRTGHDFVHLGQIVTITIATIILFRQSVRILRTAEASKRLLASNYNSIRNLSLNKESEAASEFYLRALQDNQDIKAHQQRISEITNELVRISEQQARTFERFASDHHESATDDALQDKNRRALEDLLTTLMQTQRQILQQLSAPATTAPEQSSNSSGVTDA